MPQILEYDNATGDVVVADTTKDRYYDPRGNIGATLQQSMIPGVAKNMSLSYTGASLDPGVKGLQVALNRLSPVIKNTAIKVSEDGLMGPKTQAATNAALKAIKANVSLPLTQTAVKAQAPTLTKLITAYIASKTQSTDAAYKPKASPASKRLQDALRALAGVVNNSALSITADGVAGAKTQTAVNLAFTKYVPVPPGYSLPFSVKLINDNAAGLAAMIESKTAELKKAATAKAVQNQKAVDSAKAQAPTNAATIDKAAVKKLQESLVALGNELKVSSLQSLVVDGLMGPKTTAATNLAMSRYVSGADAKLKTGKLTQDQIGKAATALATLIYTESIRRKEAKLQPTDAAKAQAAAAATQKQAETVKASAPAAVKPQVEKALVQAMQRAVAQLGKVVKDAALNIKDDGIVGANTRAAVNLALSRYVRNASNAMKAGLTTHTIGLAAPSITKLVLTEIDTRKEEKLKREADAKAAAAKLGPEATKAVQNTAAKAAQGDTDAQKEMHAVANAAANSTDPEIQDKAQDAIDVAMDTADKVKDHQHVDYVELGPAEIVDDSDREIWGYTDERKINMPLDMIEDDAELGAMIGMGEHLDGDVGWGFLKKVYKKAKRGIKKGARGVSRGVRKVSRRARRIGRRGWRLAKRGARTVYNLHKLPLKFQLKLLRRYALPLAKQYCRLPSRIQLLGTRAAGVDPKIMAAFCFAVKKRKNSTIQSLFPVAMKVAVKLAVQGQFPAAVPIIRAIKMIPGVSKLPGMSWIAGDIQAFSVYDGAMGGGLSAGCAGCGDEALIGDPMMMYDELLSDEATTMDGDLEDPPGWEYLREDSTGPAVLGAYWDNSGTGGCSC